MCRPGDEAELIAGALRRSQQSRRFGVALATRRHVRQRLQRARQLQPVAVLVNRGERLVQEPLGVPRTPARRGEPAERELRLRHEPAVLKPLRTVDRARSVLRGIVVAEQPQHLGELGVRPGQRVRRSPRFGRDEVAEPGAARLQVIAAGIRLGEQQLDPGQREAAAVQQRLRVDRAHDRSAALGVTGGHVDQREVRAGSAIGGRLADLAPPP